MNKLILFVLFTSSFLLNDLTAQQYSSAIGIRIGYPISASYKKFIGTESLLEFTAGTRNFDSGFVNIGIRQWIFGGAYQIQKELDLGDFTGLDYYYGGGVSVSFWTFGDGFGEEFSTTTLGLQGYIGLSYAFDDVPINITLDWVPSLFIGNGFVSGLGFGFGSVAVRYILNR